MTWISMVTIVFPSEYQWYRDDCDGHYQKTMLCCCCYCCEHVQLRVMVEVVVVVVVMMMTMMILLVRHDFRSVVAIVVAAAAAVVVVASVVVVLFGVRQVLVSSFSCVLISWLAGWRCECDDDKLCDVVGLDVQVVAVVVVAGAG